MTNRSTRALVGAAGAVAVAAGLVLVATGPASAAETATGGNLSWGVKASFRSYLASPFTAGTATTAGGATTAVDGTYSFPTATGTVDGSSIDAAFSGTVNFYGHAGVLDTTFSDLELAIDGSTGTLFIDADSNDMSGATTHYEHVPYVTLDLTGVTPATVGDETTWTAIPTTMTAEGAPILASYPAGTVMDPLTFTLALDQTEEPDPGTDPGTSEEADQDLTVVVPEGTVDPEPGTFAWEIEGDDSAVSLGTAAVDGDHLAAAGQLKPVVVTDTRSSGSAWSITAQVSDFVAGSTTVDGSYLGWTPKVVTPGGDAAEGDTVPSGLLSGDGLSVPARLGSAPTGHAPGTATLGADLDLELPTSTTAGTYGAVLTLTALS